jgi:hypothetical protein
MIFVTGFINLVINTTLDISQSMKEGRRKMYTGSPVRVLLWWNNRMATSGIIVWLLPITQQKYQGTLHAVRKRQQQQPTNGRLISRNHNTRSPVSLLPISSQASGISFTKTFCHQKKLNQRLANGFYVVNDYFFCRRIGHNYLYLSS